jgi:hypothetical protein
MAIWTNPDGSQQDIPDSDPTPQRRLVKAGVWRVMRMPSGERIYVQESPGAPAAPLGQRAFMRKIASRGGRARATRHGRHELAAWGRMRRNKASAKTIGEAMVQRQPHVGSQFQPLTLSAAEFRLHVLQLAIPPSRDEYLRQIGRKGGQARAARHSAEERRRWAQLGGMAKAKKAALQGKNGGARPTSKTT